MKMIIREILKCLDLNIDQKTKLESDNCSQDRMIEYIKTFFKGRQQEDLLKKKHHSTSAQDKRFILCLDNAEDAIEKDNSEFTKFLAELHDECDNLCVLITTNRVLGELANNHKAMTFIVH